MVASQMLFVLAQLATRVWVFLLFRPGLPVVPAPMKAKERSVAAELMVVPLMSIWAQQPTFTSLVTRLSTRWYAVGTTARMRDRKAFFVWVLPHSPCQVTPEACCGRTAKRARSWGQDMGYAHRMAWWAAACNRLCRHIARHVLVAEVPSCVYRSFPCALLRRSPWCRPTTRRRGCRCPGRSSLGA